MPSARRFALLVSLGLLGLSLVTSSSPALAQRAPAAEADALVEEGLRLRTEGHDDEALVRFQRAYALAPSARTQAQVALAEQALGRWAEADEHLTEALTNTSEPFIQRNRAALEQAHATIRTHVGRLEVRSNVPDAELVIGATVAGPVNPPRARTVPAGSLTFTVRATGYAPATRTVVVGAGELRRETVDLAPGAAGSELFAPELNVGQSTRELRELRRRPRAVFHVSVGGGQTFHLPTLSFGMRFTVLSGRVDLQARGGAAFHMITPWITQQYGVVLVGDFTVRARPISEVSPFYVGLGLLLEGGLGVLTTTTTATPPVTTNTLRGLFAFGGVFEAGLLLGRREQWDLGLRAAVGFGIVEGVISVGHTI